MKSNRYAYALALIFAATAILRIGISYHEPALDYDSYFFLRNAENIIDSGSPLFHDPLSYQGRETLFAPLFHYISAVFLLFFTPVVYGKIILNIIAASIVIIVYMICTRLTRRNMALICAFFSGIVPAYFSSTQGINPYSLIAPIFFLLIYLLMDIRKKKNSIFFIGALLILVFSHPIAYVLILIMILYLLFQKVERFGIRKIDLEILLFTSFLVIWLNFLIYKKAFLYHGLSIVWQNIPSGLLSNYFSEFTILQATYLVGVIPLLLGSYGAYSEINEGRRRIALLLISSCTVFSLLLIFRIIALIQGLIFLSLSLVILSAPALAKISDYLRSSKLNWSRIPLLSIIFLLFMMTSFSQSILLGVESLEDSPTEKDIEALKWLKDNSPKTATILSPIEEGHTVAYFTGRKNVADTNFLLAKDAGERYDDINKLFKQKLNTGALEILQKYNVDYIFLSERKFQDNTPDFMQDTNCYDPIKGNQIYEVTCKLN